MLIAHTTDLTVDDDAAFVVAVALAAKSGARLASVHACVGSTPSRELPAAADVLREWPGAPRELSHERIHHSCCDDVSETLLDALRRLQPDLVVAATHARTGLGRVLAGSVAEAVARNVEAPTLLLPIGGGALVDCATGALRLDPILVPAGDDVEARRGLDAAVAMSRWAGADRTEIVLLHVDDGRPAPSASVPPTFRLTRRAAAGALEQAIFEAVCETEASLVVMATRGHDGAGDVLFGSRTERVLHAARRPLLCVPIR